MKWLAEKLAGKPTITSVLRLERSDGLRLERSDGLRLERSGPTSSSATRRQRKLRTKPLFAHFLSTQPLYGIPTQQVRSRPLRRSNAEQQDGSPTDIARHHALTPCLMPSTGQHSKNNAGELGWRCSTSSTMVLSPSTPSTCQNYQAAD